MTEHHRKDDVSIATLHTRFEDFMERYDRDAEATDEWRKKFEKEVNDLKDSVRPLLLPYRIMVAVLTITGTAFLLKLMNQVLKWLQAHF